MVVGSIIKLLPKSKKGKDRIRSWGSDWIVLEDRGLSLLLKSSKDLTTVGTPDSARWVMKIGDPDFDVLMAGEKEWKELIS